MSGLIKFRLLLRERLSELYVMREKQNALISESLIISRTPTLRRKLREIDGIIHVNNQFYKLIEEWL